MLVLPRAQARSFRSVLRLCCSTLSREPPPLVQLQGGPEGLTLHSVRSAAALRLHLALPQASAALTLDASVLTRIESRSQDLVQLELVSPGQGRACWSAGGQPQTLDFPLPLESASPFPELPKRLSPIPLELLEALHQASATAAPRVERFALDHILLCGRSGTVVGTDGRTLLAQEGWRFPWKDEVLVPRLLAWGHPELRQADSAFLGRTETHLVLQTGPWTLAVPSNHSGRYPVWRSVLPATSYGEQLAFTPADVEQLQPWLLQLPREPASPAWLLLELGPAVRLHADAQELELPGATWSGSAHRVYLDSRYLLRALELGRSQLKLGGPNQPILCLGPQRRFLFLSLPAPREQPTPEVRNGSTSSTIEESVMPAKDPRADPAATGRAASPAEPPDLLEEVEALRDLLRQADVRLGRLQGQLRQQRRQARAVQGALRSLRQLSEFAPEPAP